MKDIVITKRRQVIEIVSIIVCLLAAVGVNVYAISTHHAPWSELYTSAFYVLTFAAVLYAAWVLLRLIVGGILLLCKKKKRK